MNICMNVDISQSIHNAINLTRKRSNHNIANTHEIHQLDKKGIIALNNTYIYIYIYIYIHDTTKVHILLLRRRLLLLLLLIIMMIIMMIMLNMMILIMILIMNRKHNKTNKAILALKYIHDMHIIHRDLKSVPRGLG